MPTPAKLLLPALLGLYQLPAHAQWYETTGRAPIRQGDEATARAQATEDAVKRALLFAGVSVRSVQQVTDGLLTQESLQVESSGEVQNVQLVTETTRDGYFEVTIRADIEPAEAICPTLAYRKKLLITPFRLANPEQAIVGDLFNIGKVSGKVFSSKLEEVGHSSWPAAYNNPIDVTALSYLERKALQQQLGARYILTASIDDVSLGGSTGTNWTFWTDADRDRYYHLQVQVFDLAEERTVFSQKYQTTSTWTFRKSTEMDPGYHRFWETTYGQAAERILNAAAMDVEEAIRCEPLQAEVTQVKENKVLLSIGKAHGAQIGDTFKLVHRREVPDSFGRIQPLLAVTELTVRITQLSSEAAWAESVGSQLLANIQAGDLAMPTRQPVDEFGDTVDVTEE
jgi:hypothetical protein